MALEENKGMSCRIRVFDHGKNISTKLGVRARGVQVKNWLLRNKERIMDYQCLAINNMVNQDG